jgi:TonB-linked SusC/RagA family outer membrane protein
VHSLALYGEEAINGAILITTKRGKAGRNEVNTFIETGISVPKAKPNYLGSAEYMTLFNEALANDGLDPRYTQETIAGTIAQDNPFRYPDTDYYSKEFIDNFSTNARMLTELSGGKDDTRYYAHLGFNTSNDIVNILDVSAKRKSFNLRANVDFRVSDFLTANIDVVGYLNKNTGPNVYFYNTANTYLPNQFAPLIPTSLIDNPDLLENAKLIDGQFLIGGTPNFARNIYADYAFAGENQQTSQNFQFNNGLDFDLSAITEGLSAKTYFSFDYYNTFQDRQQRSYAVYDATWTDGLNGEDELSVVKIGDDVAEPVRTVQNTNFRRNYGANVQINYIKSFGENNIDATLLGYHRTQQDNNDLYDDVYNHLGFRLKYDYKDKYIVDFSSAYVTSRKLAEGNRGGFAPALALGWIASKESFLKNSKIVDYLKLNISAGTNKSTNSINGYYRYQDSFVTQGNYSWDDGGRDGARTILSIYGNPNLTFVERNEFNIGIEAVLFKSLGINANYFNTKIAGLPTQLNSIYTAFIGNQKPLSNYNENLYEGLDLGVSFQNQFGDFSIQTGVTALYVTNKRLKYDELNLFDYQNREGGPVDASFGLESLGFFSDADDIANSPLQQFGDVKPGDIKYQDQNGDNIIDNNDQVLLGDSQPDINYGINLTLKYKSFSFFALGTGQAGGEAFNRSDYFWISGNDKYSEVVRNRWTPETASTATYPRLSSGANQNNFRSSNFWMRSSDLFRISRIQLSFDFPKQVLSNLKAQNLGLYVRGSNLWTISKNRDIIDLNSNSLQFHSFTLGVVANF